MTTSARVAGLSLTSPSVSVALCSCSGECCLFTTSTSTYSSSANFLINLVGRTSSFLPGPIA